MIAVFCLAAMIQSAIGFGYALFAVPLLIWMRVSLPEAIVLVAACSLVQSAIGARHLRRAVPWRDALLASGIRIAMVFVGILILSVLAEQTHRIIKLVVGCMLCIVVTVQLVCRFHPVEKVHWAWSVLAFSTSGVLAGLCGMGGPPMVFWTLAHNWSVAKTRGFLFAVFLMSIPIQLILLYVTFGRPVLRSGAIALLLVPVVFAGAAIGLPLGNRMPKPLLRRIIYTILAGLGLSSIFSAI